MRAASGLVAVSPQDGLVSPDYAVFQAAPGVDPQYFTHLFKTELLQAVFRSESTGLGTGSSGFLRLYSDSFLSLWLPCPPHQEQRAILQYVANETSKLDALCSATERTIALLKEHRAALIAAAVTGRLHIPEAA
jgi:type I restriction enzyme S subunit